MSERKFVFLQSRVDYEMILRIPKLRTATALAARSKSRLAYLATVECVQFEPRVGAECRQAARLVMASLAPIRGRISGCRAGLLSWFRWWIRAQECGPTLERSCASVADVRCLTLSEWGDFRGARLRGLDGR